MTNTLADLLNDLSSDADAGRYARPEAATGKKRGRPYGSGIEGAGYNPEHHGAATVRACADVHLSDEFIPPY